MALIDLPDEMIVDWCSCGFKGRITDYHDSSCTIFPFLRDVEKLGLGTRITIEADQVAVNVPPPPATKAATPEPAPFAQNIVSMSPVAHEIQVEETRSVTDPEEVKVWLPMSVMTEGHLYRVVGFTLTHAVWKDGGLVGLSLGGLVSEAHWDEGGTAKPIHSLGDVVDPNLTRSELIQALQELTPGSTSP